jgi:hypothetical protein
MLKSAGLIEKIEHEKAGGLDRIFKRIPFTYWSFFSKQADNKILRCAIIALLR